MAQSFVTQKGLFLDGFSIGKNASGADVTKLKVGTIAWSTATIAGGAVTAVSGTITGVAKGDPCLVGITTLGTQAEFDNVVIKAQACNTDRVNVNVHAVSTITINAGTVNVVVFSNQ